MPLLHKIFFEVQTSLTCLTHVPHACHREALCLYPFDLHLAVSLNHISPRMSPSLSTSDPSSQRTPPPLPCTLSPWTFADIHHNQSRRSSPHATHFMTAWLVCLFIHFSPFCRSAWPRSCCSLLSHPWGRGTHRLVEYTEYTPSPRLSSSLLLSRTALFCCCLHLSSSCVLGTRRHNCSARLEDRQKYTRRKKSKQFVTTATVPSLLSAARNSLHSLISCTPHWWAIARLI